MSNITVIIPVHEYNESIGTYLQRAVDSVNSQKSKVDSILIVSPDEVSKLIKVNSETPVNIEINKGKTDYCSQVNFGVSKVKTTYFSILEFDDVYSDKWFKNVDEYIKNKPDFSIFIPIVTFVSSIDGTEMGQINEISWAMSFTNELGVIDHDCLQNYFDFTTTGSVFRVDDFIEVGGLKPSIKLSFWYEFLLRATNKGLNVFVIPKNGYFHIIDREGSLLKDYANMTSKERSFWLKIANKEFYFVEDRKQEYSEQN